MIRRYPCQAAVLFVLGIVLAKGRSMYGSGQSDGLFAAGCSAAAVLALFAIWVHREPARWRKAGLLLVLAVSFAAGFGRMYAAETKMQRSLRDVTDGMEASVQGRVVKKQRRQIQKDLSGAPEQAENGAQKNLWTVHIADCYLKTSYGIKPCEKVIVSLTLSGDEPVIGNTILVSGKIKLFEHARNDGNFDESAYYQNMGYCYKLYAESDSFQTAAQAKNRIGEFLYGIRQSFCAVYEHAMPEAEAGALSAMLLGEKSLLLDETKDLYTRSGISHILAISGLHISAIGAAVFALLRKIGLSVPASSAVSAGFLVLFAQMTGMSSSAVRAVVMFTVSLGAVCCGRAYDSVNSLAVAAVCLLAHNPCVLFLAGFQFSFAAAAGVLYGRELGRIFRPRFRLAETVFISFGIQMFTLPLTAWYYYEIPVYALLLNMLVLPFMAVVLMSGLLGAGLGAAAQAACAAAGPVFAAGKLGAASADLLLAVCSFVLKYFSKTGEWFLQFPGAVYISGRPGRQQMAVYYLILGVSVWLISRYRLAEAEELRGKQKPAEAEALSGRQKPAEAENLLRKQKKAVLPACMLCLCVLWVRLPKGPQAAVLDVGQGDGIYIHTSGGMDIFIDGGSSSVKGAGTYRIIPFLKSQGVSCIDYWFLSHLDQDHISGFLEAVESGYRIRQAVLAEKVLRDEAYEKVTALLEAHQVRVRFLKKGDRLCGEQECFTALAPDDGEIIKDRNAGSLVLLYEDCGFRAFFSGDISKDEERRLAEGGNPGPVTLYKAAHHGSGYSNGAQILEQLKPAVSVISCALENDYGHPGEEAEGNMKEHSAAVYYTMHSGRVRLKWGGGRLNIQETVTIHGLGGRS